MTGIVACGAWIPARRLPLPLLAGKAARDGAPERALAWADEDALTMAVEAARDCLRVIELTEQVVAALLVSARQGIALRRAHEGSARLSDDAEAMFLDLEARIPLIEEDRALDRELHRLLAAMRDRAWQLYVG